MKEIQLGVRKVKNSFDLFLRLKRELEYENGLILASSTEVKALRERITFHLAHSYDASVTQLSVDISDLCYVVQEGLCNNKSALE